MKSEVKFLRAAADRIGGHLVDYYGVKDEKIRKFKPVKVEGDVHQEMTGGSRHYPKP